MPLDQEGVKAQESISLGLEQALGCGLILRPLQSVVFAVEHVDHHVDTREEAIVHEKGARVEVLLCACGALEGHCDQDPEDDVEDVEGSQDLLSVVKLLALDVAEENVKDAQAKVVRHGLETNERGN